MEVMSQGGWTKHPSRGGGERGRPQEWCSFSALPPLEETNLHYKPQSPVSGEAGVTHHPHGHPMVALCTQSTQTPESNNRQQCEREGAPCSPLAAASIRAPTLSWVSLCLSHATSAWRRSRGQGQRDSGIQGRLSLLLAAAAAFSKSPLPPPCPSSSPMMLHVIPTRIPLQVILNRVCAQMSDKVL